jgi:hypothetical protein
MLDAEMHACSLHFPTINNPNPNLNGNSSPNPNSNPTQSYLAVSLSLFNQEELEEFNLVEEIGDVEEEVPNFYPNNHCTKQLV